MQLLTIARLIRARGNKGELAAIPLFAKIGGIKSVMVNRSPMTVEHTWMHGEHVIFKFQGVDTISAAERLAGADVSIPLDERPEAPEGEFYRSDLIGCEVFDDDARLLGTVADWQETAATPLVEVRTLEGRELLIPFAASIFVRIDLASRRIDVKLPDGLIDLN